MRNILAAIMLLVCGGAAAQETVVPQLWDQGERFVRPNLTGISRIRFLTTVDFPPFNFIDANGLLTGFHVDLARALCRELDILDRCQIQALPWEELEPALEKGEGEALIAGLAVTPQTRAKYAFTRSYMRFPARFVARNGTSLGEPMWRAVSGRRVGVVAGSEHEALLKDYFADAKPVPVEDEAKLHEELKAGRVDVAFGDGMRLAFWLASPASGNCCALAGGPYLASEYLGSGLAIAVPQQQKELAEAFDYALREINVNGVFGELYLRYFPVGFF